MPPDMAERSLISQLTAESFEKSVSPRSAGTGMPKTRGPWLFRRFNRAYREVRLSSTCRPFICPEEEMPTQ